LLGPWQARANGYKQPLMNKTPASPASTGKKRKTRLADALRSNTKRRKKKNKSLS